MFWPVLELVSTSIAPDILFNITEAISTLTSRSY